MNYQNYTPYQNYQPQGSNLPYNYGDNDDRLIGGGFAAPFLLGGLAGAALAPGFYRPYPYYPAPYPIYPAPYPYYPPYPYYRRRYW